MNIQLTKEDIHNYTLFMDEYGMLYWTNSITKERTSTFELTQDILKLITERTDLEWLVKFK
jgi:hypothetical protein